MKDGLRAGDSGKKCIAWAIVLSIAFLFLTGIFISTTNKNIGNRSETTNNYQQENTNDDKKFSGTKNETKIETIQYSSSTVNDPNLDEGVTEIRTKGVNGTKAITYKVTYENDEEVNREKISEEITKQPVNEVKAVGTKHNYTGSCTVSGTYRKRYASCTGDYSPQAKANAEAKAYECNSNSRAISGCYNTYR